MDQERVAEILEKYHRPKGTRGPARRFSVLTVQDILRDGTSTAAELAKFYGVSTSLINSIRSRRARYFTDLEAWTPHASGGQLDDEGKKLSVPNMDVVSEPFVDYRGNKRHRTKTLTDRQVLEAKTTQTSCQALAQRFGVSPSTVWRARVEEYDPPEDASNEVAFEVAGKRFYENDLRALVDGDVVAMRVGKRLFTNRDFWEPPRKLRTHASA